MTVAIEGGRNAAAERNLIYIRNEYFQAVLQ